MGIILRRIRGILGNALVWGAGWFVLGFAWVSGVSVLRDGVYHLPYILGGAKFWGIAGAVTGAVFSAYVTAAFRNQRLGELRSGRLALWGGLAAVLMWLVYMLQASIGTSFWPLRLQDVIGPALQWGVIGSLTAFGSIKLAQRALPNSTNASEALAPSTGHALSESSGESV